MNNLISIIIPIYNKEKYLDEMLNSLNSQTSNNFEVIFINDGSKDKSEKILKEKINTFTFKYQIISKNNEGVSTTRNLGIELSKGIYIYFLDADDAIEKEFIFKLEKKIKKNNIELVWFGYDRYIRSKNEITLLKKYEDKYKYYSDSSEKILEKFLKREIPLHICGMLFKKSFLYENNVRFIDGKSYAEDQAFIIQALSYASKIVCLKESLFKYIETPNSAINTMTIKKLETLDVFFIILNCDWMKQKKLMKNKIGIDLLRMLMSYYIKYKGKKINNYLLVFKEKINLNKDKINKRHYIILNLLLKIGILLKR